MFSDNAAICTAIFLYFYKIYVEKFLILNLCTKTEGTAQKELNYHYLFVEK